MLILRELSIQEAYNFHLDGLVLQMTGESLLGIRHPGFSWMKMITLEAYCREENISIVSVSRFCNWMDKPFQTMEAQD